MKPFDHNKFIGYVCEVTPSYIRLQIPSAKLMSSFYFDGELYYGGAVGSFVTIEGQEFGFLGRIFEISLPQGEKIEITENRINQDDTNFHPIAKVEYLGLFNIYSPQNLVKTISRYPHVGAKVYSCSDEQIKNYIERFGVKDNNDNNEPLAPLGSLTSNDVICHVSLNSLFGRHCAVLGTTGGGKSWTVAKLMELVSNHTNNKCILIDATGEYSELDNSEIIEIGNGDYIFDYKNLSIDELYFLLKPSSKIQVPKLMDAIRSLKMVKLDNSDELSDYYLKEDDGKLNKSTLNKISKSKRKFDVFYYKHISEIEDNTCNFDFKYLAKQIANECVWNSTINDSTCWGNRNDTDISNCVSLISRINNVMSTFEYNNIFGFRNDTDTNKKDIKCGIHDFLNSDKMILNLDFSKVSFDYQVRELLVNAIGRYLLKEARSGTFKHAPVIVFMDESHQFLNKNISDDFFSKKELDAFEQISKESRKYGLFLCIATQMPRDIPVGTLNQFGTFIVHRLINEQDKKTVENASSAANRNSLSFLPILGESEALLLGVDFPMPLMLKISPPQKKPNSETPKLSIKKVSIVDEIKNQILTDDDLVLLS